jgi:hypothetical protein
MSSASCIIKPQIKVKLQGKKMLPFASYLRCKEISLFFV